MVAMFDGEIGRHSVLQCRRVAFVGKDWTIADDNASDKPEKGAEKSCGAEPCLARAYCRCHASFECCSVKD